MVKQNLTKKIKLTPIVLMMIDLNYTESFISSTLGLSVPLVKKILKENSITIKELSNRRKKEIKREEEILDMLRDGQTYLNVGKHFNISKSRVYQIAKKNNIKRWDLIRERKESIETSILEDYKLGLSYDEIKEKYGNVSTKIDGVSILKTIKNKRNNLIVSEYKNNTAKSIVISKDVDLSNPNKINTVDGIYRVTKKLGFKKYPNIGERCKGGLFEDKKVIKFIKFKRMINKLSFIQIAILLNEKGLKTPMGKEYTYNNVRSKYLSILKNNL